MYFEGFREQVEVINEEESNTLRDLYIKQFIDTNKEYFLKYVANKNLYSDGYYYTGYLWDCLIQYSKVTLQYIFEQLSNIEKILVLWDIHSKDKIYTIWVSGTLNSILRTL
jgi:hypothetical protein